MDDANCMALEKEGGHCAAWLLDTMVTAAVAEWLVASAIADRNVVAIELGLRNLRFLVMCECIRKCYYILFSFNISFRSMNRVDNKI